MEDLISYPRGWEWLKTVPTEDFNWLIEIFSTMTGDTDTYDFATFDKEATNGEPPYPVIEINRRDLADFMNYYFDMEKGITTHSHYIMCKALEIKSEDDYISALPKIKKLLGTYKKHPIPSQRTQIPNNMKIITTLVLLDNIQEPLYPVLYHSLEEDPDKAEREIIQQVNDIYGSILDEFSSIEQIKAHFKHAYLERHQILPTKQIIYIL